MKINTKLTISFLLISLVSLAAITISYFYAKEALTNEVLNHLKSVATIKRNEAENIIDHNLEKLALIISRTQLRLTLKNFISDPKKKYIKKINKILNDAKSSINSFKIIHILAQDGKIAASTDMETIGTIFFNKEFVIKRLNKNTIDHFYINGDQNLGLYLSGPLYLENEFLGVVVIKSDANNIIELTKDYIGLGKTGETVLAKRDENGDALFLTPLRFDQYSALNRTVSKNDQGIPITQALQKQAHLFTDVIDYRGKPVLAATEYIAKADWGLVVKIDKAEAFAPIILLRNLLVFTILVSSIVFIIISFYIARSISRPIIKLSQATSLIAAGDLSYRISINSKDEIGQLAEEFNKMSEKLMKTLVSRDTLSQEVTKRIQAEKQIKNSLKEKEVLLQEIHHRVKNNMQVISSLLLLQSKYIKDEQDLELFNESRNRIKSMSLIYEKLYQSKDMANIDFNDYIKNLANEMLRFYRIDVNKIALKINIEDISFGIDTAVPLGLVINELLSNCLKYAFPEGKKGKIRILMRKISDLGLREGPKSKIRYPKSWN